MVWGRGVFVYFYLLVYHYIFSFQNLVKTCSYDGRFPKTHGHIQDLCYLCKSHNVENHTVCTGVELWGKMM